MACKSEQRLTQDAFAQCSVCSGSFASMSEMCWIVDRAVQKACISDSKLLHANLFFLTVIWVRHLRKKKQTPKLLVYNSVYFVYSSFLVLLYFSVVFGNSNGLAVVDYLQKTLLLNMGTSELYSPSEPYQRQPRSPRKARQPSGGEL